MLNLVLFEPTSVSKASVIFQKPVELALFPKHSINVITPNIYELTAMYNAAKENGHFERMEWWSILDSFKVTSQFRQGKFRPMNLEAEIDVEILLRKTNPEQYGLEQQVDQEINYDHLLDLTVEGSVQQAMALLPYIPNILIKLGPRGTLCVRLAPKGHETKEKETNTLRLRGANVDVIVRYSPGLKHEGIVSVTGAGYLSPSL